MPEELTLTRPERDVLLEAIDLRISSRFEIDLDGLFRLLDEHAADVAVARQLMLDRNGYKLAASTQDLQPLLEGHASDLKMTVDHDADGLRRGPEEFETGDWEAVAAGVRQQIHRDLERLAACSGLIDRIAGEGT